MLISQFAPTSVKISEHSDQYCGFKPISPKVNFGDNSPIATMIKDCWFLQWAVQDIICNCSPIVLKFYVLLGHHTKLTHAKFCDKICHILRVMGKNECARHYKSGFRHRKLYGRHAFLVHKFDISVSHMLKVCSSNVTHDSFPIVLGKSWWVLHFDQEILTLFGWLDFH